MEMRNLVGAICLTMLTTAAACAQDAAPAAGGRGGGFHNPNLPTQAQWDANPQTQAYVAKAKEIAGNDPDLVFDEGIFCKASGGAGNEDRATIGVPDSLPHLTPYPAPEPAVDLGALRLFDNFYWIGDTGVGSWLITSKDGYILFDTLNTPDEARDVLIPGMIKMGLDPNKIKYVVFGHWHLDHTGGGAYIESHYHPKLIMGRDDWDLYFKAMQSNTGQAARIKDKTPMTRGTDATDGMKITVGDVTATIYLMPGHTPGSLGMIVPVKFHGKEHPILLLTAATDFHNRDAFVGGYEHIWDIGIEDKVESVMQVHPNTNMNILARMKYVNDNYPPATNPLLYGAARTERYINIMRACSQARMAALGW